MGSSELPGHVARNRDVWSRAREDAVRHAHYSDFDPEWSRAWPAEEIWVARKKA